MDRNVLNEVSRLRREEAGKSILAFAWMYLEDHLKCPPSQAHLDIYCLLQRILIKRSNKIAIVAPRDFGKSTLVTLIYILFCMCFGKEKHILVISNTASQACQILDNVRKELTENPLLASDFPELYGPNGRLMRSREGDLITYNNIKVYGLGAKQNVRGRRFGNSRPSLVVGDDLESAESAMTDESRQKIKDWFEKSVLKVGTPETNYILIGNLFHPYSLQGEYVNKELSPSWESYVYSAIISWPTSKLWDEWKLIRRYQSQYKEVKGPQAARTFYEDHKREMDEGVVLLWPQRYNILALMELNEDNPLSFMSEFQNTPVDYRVCPFQLNQFHYWTDAYRSSEELLRSLGEDVDYFLACDPSVGESVTKNDYSAIAIVARDRKHKVMYLIEADIKRRSLDDLLNDILDYCKRYKFTKVGFEANNFQSLLVTNFKKLLRDNNLSLDVVPIKNMTDKVRRILGLLPYLKSGQLQLSKNFRLLLEQLEFFPRAKNDDGPDALEMVVRLCEDNQNEFSFWFGGSTIDPWTGEVLTSEEQMKRAAAMPADGRVPYGWFQGRRPY